MATRPPETMDDTRQIYGFDIRLLDCYVLSVTLIFYPTTTIIHISTARHTIVELRFHRLNRTTRIVYHHLRLFIFQLLCLAHLPANVLNVSIIYLLPYIEIQPIPVPLPEDAALDTEAGEWH